MTLDDLDRLVGEKVMGLPPIALSDRYVWHDGTDYEPTRRIEQAWECLEKTNQLFALGKIFPAAGKGALYQVELYGELGGEVKASERAATAPLAIVRACLKARGVEV